MKTSKDIDVKIRQRQVPVDGMKALILCVHNDLAPMVSRIKATRNIEKIEYIRFMALLYASLYALAPQGRVSGVQWLNETEGNELLLQGYTLAKIFKTAYAYGYQPVSLSEVGNGLFKLYLTHLRPIIIKLRGENIDEYGNSPLFLTWEGDRELNVGRLITKYFTQKLGLHITTTTIRSLIGTQSYILKKEGLISDAIHTAVNNVSGHSAETMEKFYLLHDRTKDMHLSREMFSVMTSQFGIVTTNDAEAPKWCSRSLATAIDWGTKHPDYGKTNSKRAQWSTAELNFIRDFVQQFKVKNPMSKLLKYITSGAGSREAQPIFHKKHTLTSAHLRHGYRIVVGDRPGRCPTDFD
jgi:hypothetical protein